MANYAWQDEVDVWARTDQCSDLDMGKLWQGQGRRNNTCNIYKRQRADSSEVEALVFSGISVVSDRKCSVEISR